MITLRIARAVVQVARLFECKASELRGLTLGELFRDAERNGGVTVAWGCWTAAELATQI